MLQPELLQESLLGAGGLQSHSDVPPEPSNRPSMTNEDGESRSVSTSTSSSVSWARSNLSLISSDLDAGSLTSDFSNSCRPGSGGGFIHTYFRYIAASLKRHVVTRDRRYHAVVYKNCFIASEAIDFLVTSCSSAAPSRSHAVLLCKHLGLSMKLFEHVTGEHGDEFEDDYLFFRFVGIHSIGNETFADMIRDFNCPLSELVQHNLGTTVGLLADNWEHDLHNWDGNLAKIAVVLKERVEVKDRRFRVTVYTNAFLGSEAIDVIMEARTISPNRAHALHILRLVNEKYGIFEHVCQDHHLEDRYLFYHFIERINPQTAEDTTNADLKGHEIEYFAKTDAPWKAMTTEELEALIVELTQTEEITSGQKSLSYQNNFRRDGSVMTQDEIQSLRQRHGFCLTCPDEPIRLYVIKRSRLNPLYQKKKILSVPGQSRKGVCLKCTADKAFNRGPKGRQSLTNVATAIKIANALSPDSTSIHSSQCSDGLQRFPSSVQSSCESQSTRNAASPVTTSHGEIEWTAELSKLQKDKETSHVLMSAPPTQKPPTERDTSHLQLLAPAPIRRSNSDDAIMSQSRSDFEFFDDIDERRAFRRTYSGDGLGVFCEDEDKSTRPSHCRADFEETFAALHEKRHLLSKAHNASQLQNVIGSIRQNRSRSPSSLPFLNDIEKLKPLSPFKAVYALKSDPTVPVRAANMRPETVNSSQNSNLSSDSITSNDHPLDAHVSQIPRTEIETVNQARVPSAAPPSTSAATNTDGPGNHGNGGNQSLQGSINALAQITDQRLGALERQITLLVLQQKQQNFLIEQNNDMLRQFLEVTISSNDSGRFHPENGHNGILSSSPIDHELRTNIADAAPHLASSRRTGKQKESKIKKKKKNKKDKRVHTKGTNGLNPSSPVTPESTILSTTVMMSSQVEESLSDKMAASAAAACGAGAALAAEPLS